MIAKALATLAWLALIAGLIWTGKTPSLAAEPMVPLPPTEIPILDARSAPLSVTPAASGSVPWFLLVSVGSAGDAQELLDWLEQESPAREISFQMETSAPAEESASNESEAILEIEGKDLRYVDSRVRADRAQWVLAEGFLEFEEGKTSELRATIQGADADRLIDRDLVFFLGENREVLPINPRAPKAPGFLLLAGALGVFTHLFLLWGRLVIPWRETLPDEPGLI